MALEINNAAFSKDTVPFSGLSSVYINLSAALSRRNFNVYVGLMCFKDSTMEEVVSIDFLEELVIDYTTLITEEEYFTDAFIDTIHDECIRLLEIKNPTWLGKITKKAPAFPS